ncbi:hypothetical protein J5N97_026475 [Dioscorea zingiberensis]|uniref:Pectinesterase catalytic domain-containing protein n=1 Tax=Dioscorea zingiberensis TaxID=325984 RepID=A0A9D5C3L4_9LILI|nr:hypothetical protein J5N97_026475 [Dioscorea zingiberensis]
MAAAAGQLLTMQGFICWRRMASVAGGARLHLLATQGCSSTGAGGELGRGAALDGSGAGLACRRTDLVAQEQRRTGSGAGRRTSGRTGRSKGEKQLTRLLPLRATPSHGSEPGARSRGAGWPWCSMGARSFAAKIPRHFHDGTKRASTPPQLESRAEAAPLGLGAGGWQGRLAVAAVVGDSFMGVGLGMGGHQAMALRVNSDVSIFLNCRMEGYQDTLYAYTNRQYNRGCVISVAQWTSPLVT